MFHSEKLPPIDFRAELNDEQYAAVTSADGPCLILAGAGSGKTRTLTYRVAYLIHRGVPPDAILLLTFTNKAAREMLSRVEDLTSVPRRQFWGGTFHSVGQRILRLSGESVGIQRHYNILDEGEAESLLKNAIQSVDPQFLKDKNNPKPKRIANLISYARNTCRSIQDEANDAFSFYPDVARKISDFAEAYRRLKLEQQVTDYDDLLEYLLKLLREDEAIRNYYQYRFQHVLVDEYQDTNKLQSEIINLLVGESKKVMAVGDDAQCIYTWRGADFTNIMGFTRRYQGAEVHKIETNYRSSPEILDFANAVLAAQPAGTGYHKELRPVRPTGERPFLIPVMDANQQAEVIIARVQSLLDEGRNLSDIAVLYRAHYQAMELQMELSRAGIDFQITSGVRFFEQAHIRDLAAQLRFIANPSDSSAFNRFAGLLPKVGPKTAERLLKLASQLAAKKQCSVCKALCLPEIHKKVPVDAAEEWRDLSETLDQIDVAARDNESAAKLVQIAINGWYGTYLRNAYDNYEDREDDLLSLVGFASEYQTLSEFLSQLVLLASETAQRSDENKDAMRLTTIHQAKGLEFPVVFVIGLADGLFPLKRVVDDGSLEEERRLFYVSVTRAEDELYLLYPIIARQGGGVLRLPMSRFLGEVSPARYQKLHLSRPSW
jgi:DNA helicase-2/ATP-dependent DNA helicase PcrA